MKTEGDRRKASRESRPGGDERQERIAVAAYYNAERRGFVEGGAVEDWLDAERQVDGRSSEKGSRGEAAAKQRAGAGGDEANADVSLGRPDFPAPGGSEAIEPDQVQSWADRLEVSAPRLREAIRRVGPLVADVKKFLADHRG